MLDRSPMMVLPDVLFESFPETIRFDPEPTRRFLSRAVQEHQRCLDSRDADGFPSHVPNVTGLLFGDSDAAAITIHEIEFVANVRGTDSSVIDEFERSIIPQFGEQYRDSERGFWSDDKAVFAAVKRQAASGLKLMGSIHSHPNWHEIGPPHQRFQELSEQPTKMDEYLFQQACWPVNVIWYVRASSGGMTHRVAGWRPGRKQCNRLKVRLPVEICDEFAVES
jgi:hypothetical protein